MCVVCNHHEPPDGHFRSSYLCGLLFGLVTADAGGRKSLTPIINGLCSEHRKLWQILDDAYEKTGTAKVLASRRTAKEKLEAAAVQLVERIAQDTEGDVDPWSEARKLMEEPS